MFLRFLLPGSRLIAMKTAHLLFELMLMRQPSSPLTLVVSSPIVITSNCYDDYGAQREGEVD